ncbi:MAG: flippase [Calditrichaeota bacterium]|nr:MAG: flippase [Calditrichota bacterium]MBL1204610.1 flippase [Calditrichota bacterium]NOG44439.1 flippase [Calditrichota bacterium]
MSFLLKIQNKIATKFSLLDVDFREIAKSASSTFILKNIALIFSYIFNLILAWLYGADVIGIYSLMLSVYSIFSLFGSFGSQTSVVRYIAEYAGKQDWNSINKFFTKITKLILSLSLLMSIMFYLSSEFISIAIFNEPRLVPALKMTAFLLPVGSFFVICTSALRGIKSILPSITLQTVLPLTNIIILLILSFTISKSYLNPIYMHVITTIILSVLGYITWLKYKKRFINEDTVPSKNIISYKEIINVSTPMIVTAGMFFIMGWTDTFMLGIYSSTKEIGIYRIALKISIFISFALGAVNAIAGPKFSELFWSGQNERLKDVVNQSAKLIFWVTLPIFIFLLVFSFPILNFFGPEFIKGQNVLIILGIGQLFNALFGSVGLLMDMSGNQAHFRNAMIIGAIVNVLLNYLLIPTYGILGAAIGTGLSTIIWNLIAAIKAYNIFGYWIGYNPQFSKL